jgi:hypothetical protein
VRRRAPPDASATAPTGCNTCAELKEAYAQRRWGFPEPTNFEQCRREARQRSTKLIEGEGCSIFGTMHVARVTGTFSVSPVSRLPSAKLQRQAALPSGAVSAFNVTHHIKRLSFGTDFPGQRNPLDGVVQSSPSGAAVSRYFLKVVPTTYEFLGGVRAKPCRRLPARTCMPRSAAVRSHARAATRLPSRTPHLRQPILPPPPPSLPPSVRARLCMAARVCRAVVPLCRRRADLSKSHAAVSSSGRRAVLRCSPLQASVHTNQFSVTQYFKSLNSESSASMVPIVAFVFELTPLKVKKTERRAGSFFSFATRCAALIGGLFTVAGIVDSMVYTSARQIEKLQLNKQG